MDWQTLLTGGGAVGLVGAIVAIVKVIVDARKAPAEMNRTDAEADTFTAQAMATVTTATQAAATAIIEPLVAQVKRQDDELNRLYERQRDTRERMDRMDDELRDLRRDRELHRDLLLEHAAVDHLLVQRLRDHGIEVADLLPLPPLTLPHN
ncbi:hypothetical protein [Kineococcus gynurae]|uniref:Uncharacterized protein n=1 Tax=Kineococcus gynurae TaxID=452979 RepID=A0ABV5LWZ3_9ACTN